MRKETLKRLKVNLNGASRFCEVNSGNVPGVAARRKVLNVACGIVGPDQIGLEIRTASPKNVSGEVQALWKRKAGDQPEESFTGKQRVRRKHYVFGYCPERGTLGTTGVGFTLLPVGLKQQRDKERFSARQGW